MRRIYFVLIATAALIAAPGRAQAQDSAKQDPKTPAAAPAASGTAAPDSKGAPGATAKNTSAPDTASAATSDSTAQPDAQMSLGEIARLARARKNSQPKSAKLFDDDNMVRAPLSAGEKAPGFSGDSSSGGGKVTLLDFWATWCGPCRHALPGLKQLASVYGGGGFEVVSVSEDEDQSAWKSFVAENGMSWNQQFDGGHQMARQYGASALPTYILIGKDGRVVQQWVGDDPAFPLVERIGPDIKKAMDPKAYSSQAIRD